MGYVFRSFWRCRKNPENTASLSLDVDTYASYQTLRACTATQNYIRHDVVWPEGGSSKAEEVDKMRSAVYAARFIDHMGAVPTKHRRTLTHNSSAYPFDSEFKGVVNYIPWVLSNGMRFLTVEDPLFHKREHLRRKHWGDFHYETIPDINILAQGFKAPFVLVANRRFKSELIFFAHDVSISKHLISEPIFGEVTYTVTTSEKNTNMMYTRAAVW